LSKETERLFRSLLKELRPLFKENGFRASGQNFVLDSAECWVIINFQKSRWAERDETTFYVNVAASSKRWLGFHGKPANNVPPFYACDWQWRVEYFAPDEKVKQWTLHDETSFRSTLVYLQSLFREFVLPATRTMTTEAELLKHTGGFEYPQLKTRSVILAATNQVGALKQTVAKLIEKFGSGVGADGTRDHLTMLRSKYPEAMHSVELPSDGEQQELYRRAASTGTE
jgi:hypothetical protein